MTALSSHCTGQVHPLAYYFCHFMCACVHRFKVRDRFEFPMALDMYKYTAEGLAAMEGSSAQVLLGVAVMLRHAADFVA